ncbi:hypothetical protein BZA70DRAFT_204517 [Myxozyma melibiosi]|uniref:Telomere replication protein EST3 n=1 Tax=Myxozyma melibiosi TaxID=54550 RepID=A0ABR1F2V9_9ASCO
MTSEIEKAFLRKKILSILTDGRTVNSVTFKIGPVLNEAVQLIKIITYVSNPPNEYIQGLVSDKKFYINTVFSNESVVSFKKKYARRFTYNTSGCMLRITEADLHLFPSSCIGNPIKCDLNVSTPFMNDPPADRFRSDIKFVPVLYVRKFSYIGADGAQILGSPVPIRRNKSIWAAIAKRIESLREHTSHITPIMPSVTSTVPQLNEPTQFRSVIAENDAATQEKSPVVDSAETSGTNNNSAHSISTVPIYETQALLAPSVRILTEAHIESATENVDEAAEAGGAAGVLNMEQRVSREPVDQNNEQITENRNIQDKSTADPQSSLPSSPLQVEPMVAVRIPESSRVLNASDPSSTIPVHRTIGGASKKKRRLYIMPRFPPEEVEYSSKLSDEEKMRRLWETASNDRDEFFQES